MPTTSQQDMSRLLERLRIQTRFRELKKNLGEDQALELISQALRLEFACARDRTCADLDQVGSKNDPVATQ